MEKNKALAYIYFSQFTLKSTLAVARDRNAVVSKVHDCGYELVGICNEIENEEKSRPELDTLLENLDNRNYDVICILGIRHISRDSARLLEVIKKLNAKGVKLIDLSCNCELTAANLSMMLSTMALASYYKSAFEREETADEISDDYDYEADAMERFTLEKDAMLKYMDFINHYPESEEADEADDFGIRITVGDRSIKLPLNENTFNAVYDLVFNIQEGL